MVVGQSDFTGRLSPIPAGEISATKSGVEWRTIRTLTGGTIWEVDPKSNTVQNGSWAKEAWKGAQKARECGGVV